MLKFLLFAVLFFQTLFTNIIAQDVIIVNDQNLPLHFQKEMYLSKSFHKDSIQIQRHLQIHEESFVNTAKIPMLFTPEDKFLAMKFALKNQSSKDLYIEVAYPIIEKLRLYQWAEGESRYELIKNAGFQFPFNSRVDKSRNFVFKLAHDKNFEINHYLLLASGRSPIFLPVVIRQADNLQNENFFGNWLFGIYIGIFLALFLYNLFLLFSTGDISYLPYLLFLIFIALAQSAIIGYGFQFFWPNYPAFNFYAIPLLSAFAGITGLIFAMMFLRVGHFFGSKYIKITFQSFIGLYFIAAFLIIIEKYYWSYNLLNILGITASSFLLIISLLVARKGYRPAVFYFSAWSIFLISMLILGLRNFGVLPFTNMITYLSLAGAPAQAILLSLALADKINILRKEKEVSQAQALKVSIENEKIIREQNVLLEQRVNERTLELQEANEELTVTLSNLRDTQTQLVDAEKMASLGQLTAGIAHEINNPINFVTANINPLKRDLDEVYELVKAYGDVNGEHISDDLRKVHELKLEMDYDYLKEEISSLVQGISDGANRTSEIVRGLRSFSRLDEDAIKLADIHEGLSSTMVLLRSKISDNIEVVRDFDMDIPDIECFPGKLNQMFMNILNNAIYAISHKHYAEGEKPVLTLKTEKQDKFVVIHLKDNGIGMDEVTRKKMFDPFFTTKDVGEGTGLGMAIVYKIIEKHRGTMVVESELGVGTEFIITLPMRQPNEFE